MRLWRCRSCGTNNDFEGIERYLNERVAAAGEVIALCRYECIACDLAVAVEPMWFITEPGEKPVFIETAFEAVAV